MAIVSKKSLHLCTVISSIKIIYDLDQRTNIHHLYINWVKCDPTCLLATDWKGAHAPDVGSEPKLDGGRGVWQLVSLISCIITTYAATSWLAETHWINYLLRRAWMKIEICTYYPRKKDIPCRTSRVSLCHTYHASWSLFPPPHTILTGNGGQAHHFNCWIVAELLSFCWSSASDCFHLQLRHFPPGIAGLNM